jgi:hypothetical protein
MRRRWIAYAIKSLRGATGFSVGDERDELLCNAQQDEIALRLIKWVRLSGSTSSV